MKYFTLPLIALCWNLCHTAFAAEPATRPAADRVPANFDALKIGHDALMGREKDGIKADEFKARIMAWKIYEDKRPLYVENCIVWVQFINVEGKKTQRLAHMYRHGRGRTADDGWSLSRVLDAVYWDHADYDHALTNKEVYAFLKATWWHFDAEPLNQFITLDSNVCSATWKQITGEEPTQFFARSQPILWGKDALELAPHGKGNIYAPDVLIERDAYRMWYGAQGKDGHDRILYAESNDGLRWDRKGLALEDATANHVNDPSVVKVGDRYFMFFTRAATGVVDEIALATSADGIKWVMGGAVISHGMPGAWDALSVGRPSALYEEGVFKLWYDGRKDLPPHAPDKAAAKSATSARSVGYATSIDGVHWEKHKANPVFGHDSGGVDVKRIGNQYVMACESHRGTRVATSPDGLNWLDHGLWFAKSGSDFDNFGHVTPCLLVRPDQKDVLLYFGAAAAAAWDRNAIAVHLLSDTELDELRKPGRK